MHRVFAPFLIFISLFIGTGFVSGSIVHMGEGINAWDLSLLGIGAILFVLGSVFQDIQQGMPRIKGDGILLFLLLSLLLSIGIGMASGGMQHFVDTPSYSAILIPFGLGLGLIAFVCKERFVLSKNEWVMLISSVCIAVVVLVMGLSVAAKALPNSLTQDHHGSTQESLNDESVPVQVEPSESHGHE